MPHSCTWDKKADSVRTLNSTPRCWEIPNRPTGVTGKAEPLEQAEGRWQRYGPVLTASATPRWRVPRPRPYLPVLGPLSSGAETSISPAPRAADSKDSASASWLQPLTSSPEEMPRWGLKRAKKWVAAKKQRQKGACRRGQGGPGPALAATPSPHPHAHCWANTGRLQASGGRESARWLQGHPAPDARCPSLQAGRSFKTTAFQRNSHRSSLVIEHCTCRSRYSSLPQTHSDVWMPAARIQMPRPFAVSGPQRRAQQLCLPGSRDPACEKRASSHARKSTHQSHTHSDWAVWSAYLITPELEKNFPNWITKNWKLSNFSWKWAPSTTPSTHMDHLVLKICNPTL